MTHSKDPHAPARLDAQGIPTRPISETLLDFTAPLQHSVPDDITPEALERWLVAPIVIWNAVVLEALDGAPAVLAEARAAVVRAGGPAMRAIFDALVERKRHVFADDYRLIGRHWVQRAPDGSLRVGAEARWRGRPAGRSGRS